MNEQLTIQVTAEELQVISEALERYWLELPEGTDLEALVELLLGRFSKAE